MRIATTISEALNILSEDRKVECRRVKRTSSHCSDKPLRSVCHSQNEVFTFFKGSVPKPRRKHNCITHTVSTALVFDDGDEVEVACERVE